MATILCYFSCHTCRIFMASYRGIRVRAKFLILHAMLSRILCATPSTFSRYFDTWFQLNNITDKAKEFLIKKNAGSSVPNCFSWNFDDPLLQRYYLFKSKLWFFFSNFNFNIFFNTFPNATRINFSISSFLNNVLTFNSNICIRYWKYHITREFIRVSVS